MAATSKLFKLRKEIKCHAADIRCIAPLHGGFVTGSRDKDAKAFAPTKSTNAYNEVSWLYLISTTLTRRRWMA